VRALRVGVLLSAAVASFTAAEAHHSPAQFDLAQVTTLSGRLVRFDFKNPHVYLYLETVDDTGAPITWELEASSTPNLLRRGWTATSFTVGEPLTVSVNPPRRDGERTARLQTATRPDGSMLSVRSEDTLVTRADTTTKATSLAGIWLGRYGLTQTGTNLADWPLTAKGRAAQAGYDGTQNPHVTCIPVAAPSLMLYSNVYEVRVLEDRVVMHIEWMDVERVIHLKEDAHPDAGVRSNQGHSIGRWEGPTLVVDTRNFADNGAGNAFEIPSGSAKHLVERFTLSDDGQRIEYAFVLEDPEYLSDAVRGAGTWDYRPDLRALPNQCDPEIARRFLNSE
jgi:hypothetical protein